MKLHKQQEPHWVWRFKRRQDKLGLIMLSLAGSKTDAITDEKAQHCGIQLHPLDFHTGETSPSVIPYFMPADENLMVWQPPSVVQRLSFMRESSRYSSCKFKATPRKQRDRNLRQRLLEDLERYRTVARVLRKIPDLRSFRVSKGLKDLIEHDDKTPSITVSRAMKIDGGRRGRQCHQLVHLQTSEYPDAARPSITELQVVISLIWDRMHNQKSESQMKSKLRRYDESAHRINHHVVPTLLITMFPGAKVRVLYGYFDGQLKVQFTEPQQVTTSNFEEMMGSILKWSLPIIDGDTTEVVSLPTITEEDEDEAVTPEGKAQEGKEEKRKKKKQKRKRKKKKNK